MAEKINEKLLKILVLVSILVFPLGVVFRIGLGNGLFLIPNDIFALLVFAAFSVKVAKEKNISRAYLGKPILIFFLVGAISLIINFHKFSAQELLISSLYLARWIFYTSFYFALLSFNKNFKVKLLKLMTFSGTIILFLGFIQYFWYPNLRNLYYIGWDEHLYRLFSTFLDPNFAGAFFVMFAVFVFPKISESFKKNNLLGAVPIILIEAFAFAAVFLTYSRSAIIMLIAIVLSFSLFRLIFFKEKTKLIFGFIILSAVLISIFIFVSPKSFKTENTNLLRTTSTVARLDSAKKALTIIKNNYIFGVGFNTYRFTQLKYGFITPKNKEANSGAGTDNSFLFILATTGIVGFVSYIFLIFKMFKLGLINIRKNIFAQIFLVTLFGILVNSLFINSLFYIFLMEWMWILAGLTESPSTPSIGLETSPLRASN